jgi:hypothetical protein
MIGNVFVQSADAFDAWTKEQLQARLPSSPPVASVQGVETSDVRTVAAAPRS